MTTPEPPAPPVLTTDRALYSHIKQCRLKRGYSTYKEAQLRGTYVYACPYCPGFHRTMKPLDAASQVRLIERIFGGPVTPEKITAFNDWVPPPKGGPGRV